MVRGLYTASNGMVAQQQKLDIMSNNLANVNTAGFKRDGVIVESFKSVLTKKVNDMSVPNDQVIGKMTLGSKVGNIYTDYSQGGATATGNPYNVAITGNGMITIGTENKQGELDTKYTRDGSFVVSSNGTLMTSEGNYVLGKNGKIVLESGTHQNIRIAEDGTIFENDKMIDKIGLVDFENPESLRKIGNNLFRKTTDSIEKDFSGSLCQGYTENSNVNTVREMVDMISVTRTFEANQKVIQTQDETLGKAVNDIGRL